MNLDTARFRTPSGAPISLAEWNPQSTEGFRGNQEDAEHELTGLNRELGALQQLLYAEGKRKLLVVLQGMDSSGKDSTIRRVFRAINPLGVRAVNFVRPTERELAHDFLWRVHSHAPTAGEIAIWNRSHYEDVLVVRVHELVPRTVWEARYDHINAFEKLLADEGTAIVKFFLHISRDEQKKRLQQRLHDPRKQWKFNHGDIEERKRWEEYHEAYEAVLSRTSTPQAPWIIVPADHKWFRNLVVASVLVKTLQSFGMRYPRLDEGLHVVKK